MKSKHLPVSLLVRSETDLVFTEEGDGDEGEAGDEEEDFEEDEEVEKFLG